MIGELSKNVKSFTCCDPHESWRVRNNDNELL